MARTHKKECKNQAKYQLKSAIKAVLIDYMKIKQAANDDYNIAQKTLSDHVKKDKINNV